MSLFNNPYLLFATLSLTLQVIVMLLLLYGYWLKRNAKFVQHAQVMTTALILHLALIFTIMLPALILALIPIFIIPRLFELTSLVTLIHASLGAAAVSLGLWLVLSWRRGGGLEGCFKRRKIMFAASSVWLAALFFGFALYTILYWAAFMT